MKPVYRIAIVGTGPAGMYALEHLLNNKTIDVEVDLFERLPVPWGLLRYGVAPDHPEKKLISTNLYNHLISRENVRFFGNVNVGEDISHKELTSWFDSVIYASGVTAENKMRIPGEDLFGSHSAREFVAWYNGHPDFSDLEFDLSHKRAVIVGNGNVALDIARILSLPITELEKTDIAEHALAALKKSKIKEIVILGRRGYTNAAFNNPELEEFLDVDGLNIQVDDPNFSHLLNVDDLNIDWQSKRKVKTLQTLIERSQQKSAKQITFKFLCAPLEITGNEKVEKLRVSHQEIAIANDGSQGFQASGKQSSIDTGLVLRAIGYRGEELTGLPFDSKNNVVENQKGRVCKNGKALPGIYVTGWIKRGPKGVIGTNKRCSGETVSCLIEDLYSSNFGNASALSAEDILSELAIRKVKSVSLKGWKNIDRAEKQAGLAQQRPRVKVCKVSEMLAIAQG